MSNVLEITVSHTRDGWKLRTNRHGKGIPEAMAIYGDRPYPSNAKAVEAAYKTARRNMPARVLIYTRDGTPQVDRLITDKTFKRPQIRAWDQGAKRGG